ncbi:MAG: DNA-directed RNA polymerase subunit alpha [Alphaproteobacteria bacterium]|nr:DNA-directed RNA polymerase subunit alpha [Alphaproteobacteria bacterium]
MVKLENNCLELDFQKPTLFFGQFTFHSLNHSESLTLGTALRRILLTNIPGLAIVAVRIATVNHEFSTIPGVREDVLDILLNLKEIIFKSKMKFSSPIIGRFKVSGPAIITANSLKLPSTITICNPTQYIATITDNSILELEIKIDSGIGYLLTDSINQNDYSTDFLKIDAPFTPIQNVIFEQNEKNKELVVKIWTNGSITPTKALSLAIKNFVTWLYPIQPIYTKQPRKEFKNLTL